MFADAALKCSPKHGGFAMAHWATSPLDRSQITLFAPTLDQSIAGDHPVRLFSETLDALDFSDWEAMYVRVVGQPPIHPRVLAACILYGLSLGIRSSRKLEDAAANRLDFIWLLEGRIPDHATVCKFRTQFGKEIKDLFRQVGRVAINMGLVSLNQVMLDGTHLMANNSRYATNRRASLQQKLDALDRQVEQLLVEADAADQADAQLFGEASPTKLPKPLRDLKARQERLRQAMENLGELEKERGQSSDPANDQAPKQSPEKPGPSKPGPAIPTTDPDSRVLPAKQGGYAPGYTTVLATDAEHGFIVDTQVLAGNDEASTVLPAVENIEENFGRKPGEILADSGFNTGPNLAGLEAGKVEALMPPRQEVDASAAERPDPSQPVAEAARPHLPVNPQNKVLDRSAFSYDPAADQYRCPMGRPMPRTEDKPYNRHGNKGTYQVYQSVDCSGCPLKDRCLAGKSPTRRVCRDEHESLREAMARRMKSEAGRERYKKRAAVAERAFAVLKARMNLRQLLLRGIEKVRTEIDWAITAFNLVKLVALTAR
jgi:transposase